MKTLIGALLAVTALSPTLANAQRFGMEATTQADREDGAQRGGPEVRGGRSRFAREQGGDRFDRDSDAQRPRSPDGGGDRQWSRDRRGDPRQGGQWADRYLGARAPDRTDPDRDDRPNRRQASGDRYGDPRARNDWTRSRLDRRDDGWTRSRFAERSQWNRGWRGDDRYDWNGYRTAHRGAYRLPLYDAPGRDRYRRFAIGTGLDASLWNHAYWIADPYAYRLPQAGGPYRWVRYYDDALLVDQRGGRVVDAVYGIFW